MDSGSLDPAAALRCGGLRVTASRLAGPTAFAASAPHSSADDRASAVCECIEDDSAPTVYNVLHTFTDLGWCFASSPPVLFKLRVGDCHPIACRRCAAISAVACAVGDTPCLTAAAAGDAIDEAECISWSRCPGCIAATAISSGAVKRTHSLGHQLDDPALKPAQPLVRARSHYLETPREEMNHRA